MDNSGNPIDNNKSEEPNEIENSQEVSLDTEPENNKIINQSEVKKSKFKIPKIKFNRNTVLAASLAVLLIIVGVFSIVLTNNNNEESQDEVVVEEREQAQLLGATILIDEGTIQIISQETGEWQDANTTTVLEQGAELRTVGATSRAVIGFDDGSALRLDANSEVVLEEMTTERIVIKHVSGYTYNRVLPSESITYVVTSKDAQYEALGTAFRTASTGDEQSVEVYHSSVIETNTNKTPKEGEKLVIENKTNPSENGSITKLDIEDVKNDPFMEWNRELDLNDENFKDTLGFLSDVTAPEITIDKNDGDVVLLEPNASEGTIELTGKTESSAKLTVQSKSQSGSSPVGVSVAGDGTFKTPVLTAPIGNSVFEFIATDRAGNKNVSTLRITFQKKSQPVIGNAVSFVLSSTIDNNNEKLQLNWKIKGIEAPDGYKVVYEKGNQNPVFNQGSSQSFPTKETSGSIKFDNFNGSGTHYVKVCIYDANSGTCGQYSNSVKYEKP
jgi:hypothetical protein